MSISNVDLPYLILGGFGFLLFVFIAILIYLRHKETLSKEDSVTKCVCCKGNINSINKFCKNCGLVKNTICEDDIKIIKKNKLKIVFPFYIINTMLPAIRKAFDSLKRILKKDSLGRNEIMFATYCYLSPINTATRKKTGREDATEKHIYIGGISAVLHEKGMSENHNNFNEFLEYGLFLFTELDRMFLETKDIASDRIPTRIVIGINRIIYGEKDFGSSLLLFTYGFPLIKRIEMEYSKYFITEDSDFQSE